MSFEAFHLRQLNKTAYISPADRPSGLCLLKSVKHKSSLYSSKNFQSEKTLQPAVTGKSRFGSDVSVGRCSASACCLYTLIAGLQFESPALRPIKTRIVTTWIQTHRVCQYIGTFCEYSIALYCIVEVVRSRFKRHDRTSRDVVLNASSQSRLGYGIIRLIYNPAIYSI